MVACPNCGSSEQSTEEETLSGQFGATSQGTWSVQLLIEVLEKALVMGRTADAERILRRATAQVEERLLSGEKAEPEAAPVAASGRGSEDEPRPGRCHMGVVGGADPPAPVDRPRGAGGGLVRGSGSRVSPRKSAKRSTTSPSTAAGSGSRSRRRTLEASRVSSSCARGSAPIEASSHDGASVLRPFTLARGGARVAPSR